LFAIASRVPRAQKKKARTFTAAAHRRIKFIKAAVNPP